MPEYLNDYVFHDTTGYTAQALLVLGNAYLKTHLPAGNANAFSLMLRRYKWTMQGHYQTKKLTKAGLLAAEKEINRGLALLEQADPHCPDADIIIKETRLAAKLAIFGVHLGIARLDAPGEATKNIPLEDRIKLADELSKLIKEHKALWLVRNRIGGLSDSSGKLESLEKYLRAE